MTITEKKNRGKLLSLCLVLTIVLVAIDQVIKARVVEFIRPVGRIIVIPNVLNLTYVENSGAAFGIFQGRAGLLSVFSILFIVGIVLAIFMGKVKDSFLVVALTLIVAGGVGNVIDRIVHNFVVDYIDIAWGFLRNFPVFNFADICVTIGAVLLFIAIFRSDHQEKLEKATSESTTDEVQEETEDLS